MPLLISFSGLPGVGKTTIAKALSRQISATYLRVDVVESALRESMLNVDKPQDAGYRAICGIAESNLKLGHSVIADTVNPVPDSRRLWADAASASQARLINIEIICSDLEEHKSRVETRPADIDGHPLPSWARVQSREYHPWTSVDVRLDSSVLSVEESVARILAYIGRIQQSEAV
ncbi:MAG: AAA family ATPase [Pseudomonadota bacterium]